MNINGRRIDYGSILFLRSIGKLCNVMKEGY